MKDPAKQLKGTVKIGAVDMTENESVGAPYDVKGFPTLKWFGFDKKKPEAYEGQREAGAIVEYCLTSWSKKLKDAERVVLRAAAALVSRSRKRQLLTRMWLCLLMLTLTHKLWDRKISGSLSSMHRGADIARALSPSGTMPLRS